MKALSSKYRIMPLFSVDSTEVAVVAVVKNASSFGRKAYTTWRDTSILSSLTPTFTWREGPNGSDRLASG